MIVAFVAAWPYLLATYVAVQLGADNPSTTRAIIGWVFETPWLVFLIIVGLMAAFGSKTTTTGQASASTPTGNEIRQVRRGKSSAYVHFGCTVNHRTPETASRCTSRRT
ncbi:hypothetical protein GCM10007298_10890 [Williamsia phyllosphaerae]|uniref:Uncharacterized protein n=1 Tax=Williamsia phyllosphaerae TaxID=885042 RepID=A0ABQ1UEF0_9NOCA|nr:hypothetical protein GCM10007298_10890 [Williamsia phyllosphaerae]